MKTSLSPKVALITGAARRIGAEIARTLHAAGMRIVLHYHASNEEAHLLLAKLNEQRKNSAVGVQGNLNEIKQLPILIQESINAFGRLDLLVNNASRFYRTPLGKITENHWDDLMTCNLKAPFFLAQAAMPALLSTKGAIINIIDIHGEKPLRDYSVYSISKCGLMMLTQALAKELAPIRVNGVAPGCVMWPEGENALSDSEKKALLSRTALRQAGRAEDIAQAVVFFAQNAPFITGQILNVDGGRLL